MNKNKNRLPGRVSVWLSFIVVGLGWAWAMGYGLHSSGFRWWTIPALATSVAVWFLGAVVLSSQVAKWLDDWLDEG